MGNSSSSMGSKEPDVNLLNSQLHTACNENNLAKVKKLIKQGAQVKSLTNDNKSIFYSIYVEHPYNLAKANQIRDFLLVEVFPELKDKINENQIMLFEANSHYYLFYKDRNNKPLLINLNTLKRIENYPKKAFSFEPYSITDADKTLTPLPLFVEYTAQISKYTKEEILNKILKMKVSDLSANNNSGMWTQVLDNLIFLQLCSAGRLHDVKYVMNKTKGAVLNTFVESGKDNMKLGPLFFATLSGNLDLFKYLVFHTLSKSNNKNLLIDNSTYIGVSIYAGHFNIAKYLCDTIQKSAGNDVLIQCLINNAKSLRSQYVKNTDVSILTVKEAKYILLKTVEDSLSDTIDRVKKYNPSILFSNHPDRDYTAALKSVLNKAEESRNKVQLSIRLEDENNSALRI